MSDLVEFLLARVAEDEKAAQADIAEQRRIFEWYGEERKVEAFRDPRLRELGYRSGATYSTLAQCQLKRWNAERPDPSDMLLREHAFSYRDHPDYREEWRP